MEENPSLQFPRKRLPLIPNTGNLSQFTPHGYTTIIPSHDSEHHDHLTVSSLSSTRNSSMSAGSFQPNPQRSHVTVKVDSRQEDEEEAQKIEVYEINTRSVITDKNSLQKSFYRKIQEITTKFWLFEAVACIFSLMSLASIVGVLIYEDNKQLDQWEWSIPPTAVVSFIGTLAKASLVLVLSQVLSQLKWLHFRQSESLQHMRIFDWSSRGPLGSVMVLWSSKKIVASIAALLMIMTILVDPFVQLVFSFPAKTVPDRSQQALFLRMNDWNGENGPKTFLPSQRLWTSMTQGLAATSINTTLICPSGNCAWDQPIKTLGICGSCSNVTAKTRTNCSVFNETTNAEDGPVSTCSYVWHDEHESVELQASLWYSPGADESRYPSRTMWNSTVYNGEVGKAMANYVPNYTVIEVDGQVQHPSKLGFYDDGPMLVSTGHILDLKAIQLPPVNSDTFTSKLPQATCWDCEMHWCEKSFENLQVSYDGSPRYSTSEQSLWFLNLPVTPESTTATDELYVYNVAYGANPSVFDHLPGKVWNFDYKLNDTVTSSILLTLLGSYYIDYCNAVTTIPEYLAPQPVGTNLGIDPGIVLGLAFSDDLNVTINRLATSLTEAIRTGTNAIAVPGEVLVSKTFIHVRWAWLALPLTVMALTWILLVITAIQSHRQKVAVWKDDPLALLFHRIDGVEGLPVSNNRTGPADLDNLADKMYVKLDGDAPFTFVGTVAGGQQNRGQKERI